MTTAFRLSSACRVILWQGGGITATEEVAGEVTGEVERLLLVLDGEMPRQQIQEALALEHEDHFRNAYLKPALTRGVIEMTLPDKPRSSNQRYRLTTLGQHWLEAHPGSGAG